jgi:hypothetical protein
MVFSDLLMGDDDGGVAAGGLVISTRGFRRQAGLMGSLLGTPAMIAARP